RGGGKEISLGIKKGKGAFANVGAIATKARPVATPLDAKTELAELPVVTKLTADHPAIDIEGLRQAIPFRTTPVKAAVDTDIEAGPIVRGHDHGGPCRRRGRRPTCQVSCRCGSNRTRQSECCRQ